MAHGLSTYGLLPHTVNLISNLAEGGRRGEGGFKGQVKTSFLRHVQNGVVDYFVVFYDYKCM